MNGPPEMSRKEALQLIYNATGLLTHNQTRPHEALLPKAIEVLQAAIEVADAADAKAAEDRPEKSSY